MPDNVVSLEEKSGEGGRYATVGRAYEFKGGWGAQLFKKPHWFEKTGEARGKKDDIFTLKSLCGRTYTVPWHAYISDAGNFPKCKRCMAALIRDSAPIK